jgi:hypothetical protein
MAWDVFLFIWLEDRLEDRQFGGSRGRARSRAVDADLQLKAKLEFLQDRALKMVSRNSRDTRRELTWSKRVFGLEFELRDRDHIPYFELRPPWITLQCYGANYDYLSE